MELFRDYKEKMGIGKAHLRPLVHPNYYFIPEVSIKFHAVI